MKRIIACLCVLTMLLTMAAVTEEGAKADGVPAFAVGTSKLSKGSFIYFGGKSTTEPFGNVWRILRNEGNCTWVIYNTYMEKEKGLDTYRVGSWAGSSGQTWCTQLYNNWPFAIEKKMILATTTNEGSPYTIGSRQYKPSNLQNEHFFYLSAKEANELFGNNSERAIGLTAGYWLRSLDADNNQNMSYVDNAGAITVSSSMIRGIRPAFRLDLSAVLFLSDSGVGKPGTLSTLTKTGSETDVNWKLTVRDSSRSFAVKVSSIGVDPGDKLRIPYSGSKTGEKEYISVLICNSTGTTPLYYASIPAVRASGTVAFNVPSGFPEGDYILKVFNEQKNGNKFSDYASALKDIQLKVAEMYWSEPTYTWAKDCSTVTAKRVSRNYPDICETETVAATGVVTTPATTETTGLMTYTSESFYNPVFRVQTTTKVIPKTVTEVNEVTVSGGVYKLNHKKLTAVFTKPKDKNAKSLKIPDTVKANGKTYKVTEIKSGACKGMKKLATLTIGKNVAKIGSKAFSDCTKLKKITIKCASMAKGGFGSKCFSKINEKAVFKVPKKMLKKYEEWIIKKGKAPKGSKIK